LQVRLTCFAASPTISGGLREGEAQQLVTVEIIAAPTAA
jgi:hypothetical protein